jgi:hypothetical protein
MQHSDKNIAKTSGNGPNLKFRTDITDIIDATKLTLAIQSIKLITLLKPAYPGKL